MMALVAGWWNEHVDQTCAQQWAKGWFFFFKKYLVWFNGNLFSFGGKTEKRFFTVDLIKTQFYWMYSQNTSKQWENRKEGKQNLKTRKLGIQQFSDGNGCSYNLTWWRLCTFGLLIIFHKNRMDRGWGGGTMLITQWTFDIPIFNVGLSGGRWARSTSIHTNIPLQETTSCSFITSRHYRTCLYGNPLFNSFLFFNFTLLDAIWCLRIEFPTLGEEGWRGAQSWWWTRSWWRDDVSGNESWRWLSWCENWCGCYGLIHGLDLWSRC